VALEERIQGLREPATPVDESDALPPSEELYSEEDLSDE
jgi:hypothetical protein